MDFITELYPLLKTFPKEEQFGLTSQLKRSAISIPSNIAEGYGRNSKNDFIRFLNIAMASLFETQTQLEIAFRLEFINKTDYTKQFEQTREIERMLSSFIQSIKNNQ